MHGNAYGKLQDEEVEVKRMNIRVEGITCPGCATDIASALKNKEGVLDAEADYSTSEVSVDFDPEELNEKQVLDLINKLGLKKL